MDHRILRRWDISFGIPESLNGQLERLWVSADVCRVAGDDAVELIRIAGGLQQAL
jgi:hypothetical protein